MIIDEDRMSGDLIKRFYDVQRRFYAGAVARDSAAEARA
jgi:hypothetical protein